MWLQGRGGVQVIVADPVSPGPLSAYAVQAFDLSDKDVAGDARFGDADIVLYIPRKGPLL